MESAISILQSIEDAIMERPFGFEVNGKRFCLYPPTLGASMLIARLTKDLEIDDASLAEQSCLEIMRIVGKHKDIACRIIAYATANGKEEACDALIIDERQKFFSDSLSNDEIVQLLLLIYQSDNTAAFIRHFGLDKEQKEQARISKLKNKGGNTLMFGGKSLYGSLIGVACEKYGWTLDYVVWGISLTNLRMMIADSINSIYLTDEEKKTAKTTHGQEILNMDDPSNWAKIKAMKWD